MVARHTALIGIMTFTGLTAVLSAQNAALDWPQWRGPNRDGTLASFIEPKDWPENLTRRWKVEVGTGYATPIVVGSRVFAFTRQGVNEVMRALDAGSGKVVWETSYPAPFEMNSATARHGPGPKSTPTSATDGSSRSHERHRDCVRRGDRQAALAEAGASGEPTYHTAQSALVDRGL